MMFGLDQDTFSYFESAEKPANYWSGTGLEVGFKFQVGQIGHSVATFLRQELCCPGAITGDWTPPTRYMLWRNAASIMKDLM